MPESFGDIQVGHYKVYSLKNDDTADIVIHPNGKRSRWKVKDMEAHTEMFKSRLKGSTTLYFVSNSGSTTNIYKDLKGTFRVTEKRTVILVDEC